MRSKGNIDEIKYNSDGLVPAIVQDYSTDEVLMLAYMSKESLELSLKTKETHFYSRSRQEIWHKGATSGHVQKIKNIAYDCDGDCLLIKVDQTGVACHTGAVSCFFNSLLDEELNQSIKKDDKNLGNILELVYQVIKSRQEQLPEGSYTTYLFQKGQDKILKKVAEEAGEVIIGSKNNDNDEVSYEVSDLLYHLMVLLAYHNITLADIAVELDKRR